MAKRILSFLFFTQLCFAQINDYVSNLNFEDIYTNELSLDFVVLGIHGNEMKRHFESCKQQGLSYFSYDTIWNISHLGERSEDQKKPRVAFLNENNFHLMDFEIWDSETSNFIIGPYHPTYYGFDYYIGNGFAFIDENELTDYNNDGYLDRKVQFTKLDYEKSSQLITAINNTIFEEYQRKINLNEINKDFTLDDYLNLEWTKNNNFGLFGIGYITRYSNHGLIYFLEED